MGRFLNADGYTSTGQGILGNNMYAYCGNNPSNMTDPTGNIPVAAVVLGLACSWIIGSHWYKEDVYEMSDGDSDLTSNTYTERNPTREEKLNYAKEQTGQDHFDGAAEMYYNEYTLHEIGWYLTGWAYEKDIWLISEWANRFHDADIVAGEWDGRPEVDILSSILGFLGF